MKRELPAPYTPKVKGFDDLSNFDKFPADGGETAANAKYEKHLDAKYDEVWSREFG